MPLAVFEEGFIVILPAEAEGMPLQASPKPRRYGVVLMGSNKTCEVDRWNINPDNFGGYKVQVIVRDGYVVVDNFID